MPVGADSISARKKISNNLTTNIVGADDPVCPKTYKKSIYK